MSPEHERQAEYCQRAAQAAGLRAELEVSTGSGTRLDVAVFGSTPTGLEIQRSELSLAQAKSRTSKSAKAGFTCAWVSDRERDPRWADHVPTARLTSRGGWNRLPPPGTANVVIRNFTRNRDTRSPTGWRYVHHPYQVTLDELSYLMPMGEILPVQIGALKTRRVVLAHSSAVDVINSCTFDGAATWVPSPATPQPKEAPQRFSSSCKQHGEAGLCGCGQPLLAPVSVARGYCEACRMSGACA